jgi:molecular chaperone DnaK
LEAGVKADIEGAIKNAKNALEGQDAQAMKTAADQLSQTSHKLAEAMYAKASQQQTGQSAGNTQGPSTDEGKKKKEDVVDADFTEVKE